MQKMQKIKEKMNGKRDSDMKRREQIQSVILKKMWSKISYQTDPEFREDNYLLYELHKFQQGNQFEHHQQKLQTANQIYHQYQNLHFRAQTLLNVCKNYENSIKSDSKNPSYWIKKVRRVESGFQKQLLSIVNKLKIGSQKVQKEWTQTSQYTGFTFLYRINQTLEFIELNQSKVMINQILKQIKHKFSVIPVNTLKKYKIHPSQHYQFIQQQSNTVFYINFYISNLLFIDGVPLPFNGNLLFCPIILEDPILLRIQENGEKNYVSISQWYLKEVNWFDENWDNSVMTIILKRDKIPFIYSKADNFGIQYYNESEIFAFIRKLRRFVYLFQIQTWLWKIHGIKQSPFEQNLIITLNRQYTVEISVTEEVGQLGGKVRQEPLIFYEFFKFCLKEDHRKRSAKEIRKLLKLSFNMVLLQLQKKIRKGDDFYDNGKYVFGGDKIINVTSLY